MQRAAQAGPDGPCAVPGPDPTGQGVPRELPRSAQVRRSRRPIPGVPGSPGQPRMSLDHLTALSGRVQGSDPLDRAAQARNLDLLCEVSGFVRQSASPEVAACLLAAAHALQALAGADAALPRAEVHRSAGALLGVVLRALTPAPAVTPAAPAATPAPAPKAPERSRGGAAPRDEREARLGRMLLRLGQITRAQLARALRLHRGKRLPVGECLLLLGACAPDLVLESMKLQAQVRAKAKGNAGAQKPPAPAAGAERRPMAAFHVTKDMFLGEVLLGVGMISTAELEQAMHLHHHLGLRVGEALLKIGALTAQEVERGLELQRHLQSIATVKARP